MGVRAREFMSGRSSGPVRNSGGLHPGRLEGFDELMKQIDKVAMWGSSADRKAILKIHKAVAAIGKNSVRRQITSHAGGTIKVRRTGKFGGKRGPSYDIQKGTLKRSIRVFNVMGDKTSVMVGPRSGMIDKTVPKPSGVIRNDGYFAHFVEEGDLPQHMGGRGAYTGPNRGFFARGMRPALPRMTAELVRRYRERFDKFMSRA
tara:strand:+ start:50 stop:658 length:609 start_codon:yes stop_codon:yes gene_type:complete